MKQALSRLYENIHVKILSIDYLKILSNRLVVYILLIIAFLISISQLNHSVSTWHVDDWSVKLHRLEDAMLLAIPILFLCKKRFVFLYLLLVNIYLLSIIWYFRTYGTIMPLSSYLMFDNLNGLLPCIVDSIHFKDVYVILPSIFFMALYSLMYARIGINWRLKLHVFFIAVLFTTGLVSSSYLFGRNGFYDTPLFFFGIEQVKSFKEYGIVNFWIYQFYFYKGVSKSEENYARKFMENLYQDNHEIKYYSTVHNKNLIVILVESLQSWPIGLSVKEVDITPNIDSLLLKENTVYFPKEVPQVKDGRSSDAQLLINTGLLPLTTGAASAMCTSDSFLSLPMALKEKGYSTASYVCDNKHYWNQEAMTHAYHFDYLYDCLGGDNGIKGADESLFRKSMPILKQMQPPFYAQLVTLSSHSPYSDSPINTPLEDMTFESNEVKYYLTAIQYVDRCIGEFIVNLKKEGLYDNSVIIITGDHEQVTYNKYEGREQMCVEDCFVPFIIVNSHLASKQVDKVIGQMDIYPSLLNLMGCCDYSFMGLGESVFGDSISNYATYRNGMSAGGEEVADIVKRYRMECWKVSDILLRMDYFGSCK